MWRPTPLPDDHSLGVPGWGGSPPPLLESEFSQRPAQVQEAASTMTASRQTLEQEFSMVGPELWIRAASTYAVFVDMHP